MSFYAEYHSTARHCLTRLVVGPHESMDFAVSAQWLCPDCTKDHDFFRATTYTVNTPSQKRSLIAFWQRVGINVIET